jgi:regulatory protein
MRITAIEKQGRRRRANIYVDDRFALALSLEVIAEAGLRVGDELEEGSIEALRRADLRQAALNSALRLLSYRPRSEAEVRSRLARKGLPSAVVEETVRRLHHLRLLDDAEFAHYWVETRDRTSPRGRRLLAQELRFKGISGETAQAAIAPLAEEAAAYRAARRRAQRLLKESDLPTFRRRLGQFLLRRGFDFEAARAAVDRLWREVSPSPAPPGEEGQK